MLLTTGRSKPMGWNEFLCQYWLFLILASGKQEGHQEDGTSEGWPFDALGHQG